MTINISHTEANRLINLDKFDEDPSITWNYPGLGGFISVPLISQDKKDKFTLDIYRGRIDLRKGTFQNRTKQIIVLVRLDFGGKPHRNPDGIEVQSPHLHIYREDFGDKWAEPIPNGLFSNLNDNLKTLDEFMDYCNVILPPNINKGLFV